MRYQDVVRQYLSLREASSREWTISTTLVMSVEIDMSTDGYVTIANVTMAVGSSASQRRRGPPFLRLTVFRSSPNTSGVGPDPVFHAIDVSDLKECVEVYKITDVELAKIEELRKEVAAWAKGASDRMPPSTSTVIADRLRRTR